MSHIGGSMAGRIDTAGEWVYLKEAWQMLPQGTDISESRFREWCKDGLHGIVAGRFGGRLMVRKDTIPRVQLVSQ